MQIDSEEARTWYSMYQDEARNVQYLSEQCVKLNRWARTAEAAAIFFFLTTLGFALAWATK